MSFIFKKDDEIISTIFFFNLATNNELWYLNIQGERSKINIMFGEKVRNWV